jgi:hypothetical protein
MSLIENKDETAAPEQVFDPELKRPKRRSFAPSRKLRILKKANTFKQPERVHPDPMADSDDL